MSVSAVWLPTVFWNTCESQACLNGRLQQGYSQVSHLELGLTSERNSKNVRDNQECLAGSLIPRPEHIIWGSTVNPKPLLLHWIFGVSSQSWFLWHLKAWQPRPTLGHYTAEVQALPLTRCVTLGKSPNLCVLQFPHQQNGDNNSYLPTGLFQVLKKLSGTWYCIIIFFVFFFPISNQISLGSSFPPHLITISSPKA